MADLGAFKNGIEIPISADISGLKTGLASAQNDLTNFNSKVGASMTAAGKKMTSAGKNLSMKVTAPLMLLGTASVMTAVDFDDSMRKVGAITKSTGDEFDALREQAMELGRSTRYSSSEAAEGMTFLGMAGFDTNQIMASMPDMLNLAAAGAIDLGTAADIASNILTGFGLEAEEAGRVADVMADAAASSNTNMTQLGEAMKYVAPVAAGVGMSMENATAIIGKFSDAGIQGSMAGTSLRQAITSLLTPSDEAASILKGLGVVTKDAEGNMLPFNDILGQLETSGMSTAESMSVFGARAGPAMTALIAGGSESLDEFTTQLENSGGTAQEMAEAMESGPGGAFRNLESATEDVMIQFGDLITVALLPLVSVVQDLMGWLSGLDDNTKMIILVIAGLSAAIGPLLIVFGMVASAIGSIITIAPVLGTALTLLSANPIVLVIGGLILLFVVLQAKFDIIGKASAVLGKAFEWLSGTVSAVVDWITDAVDWSEVLGTAFKILLGPIGWVMIAMDHFGVSWDDVWNGMLSIAQRVSGFITGIFDSIVGTVRTSINWVIDGINTMIRGLNRLSFSVPDWVPGIGGETIGFSLNELPHFADGGIVTEPTLAVVGEAGPEAIVPLSGSNAGGMGGVSITVENMNVRDDQDIKKIATELYTIIDRKNGARGIR